MQATIPTTLYGELDALVTVGQQAIYRQTLGLNLATGDQADGVLIDTSQTVFSAEFETREYDLLDSSGPFAQAPSVEVADGALTIELGKPMRIHRIRLLSQPFSRVSYAIAAINQGLFDDLLESSLHTSLSASAARTNVYRDRNELRSAAQKDYGLGLPWRIDVGALELYRMDGAAIADTPTITVDNGQVLYDEFIAARFAIRGYSSRGAEQSLTAGMLENLWVRSLPTSPRIGVARTDPDTGEAAPESFFWRLSGEQLDSTQASSLNAQASALLQEALQASLDDLFEELANQTQQYGHSPQSPGPIELSLVFESDTPCAFLVNDLQVHYSLIRQASSLVDNQGIALPKQVLRFQGNHLETQEIKVHLPQDAQIHNATIETTPSFTGDNARLVTAIPARLKETDRQGIYMDDTAWAAQAVRPEKALTLTGLLLGILTLEEDVQLNIEVREDWNDGPNGNTLATAGIATTGSGRRKWLRVDFDPSVVITSALNWITVRVAKGAAVWLTETSTGQTFRGYLERGAGEQPRLQTVLRDTAGLYRYVTCCRNANPLPIRVQVDGVDVGILSDKERELVLDITSGLTAPRAEGESADVVDLEIVTPLKGMLTVRPPKVEYELV